jgi:hypothetical protein
VPAITPDSVPRRNLGARVRRFRGQLVVAVEDENFELPESAGLIFENVDGSATVDMIATRLAAHYGIDHGEAYADVVEFLGWLRDSDLIGFPDQPTVPAP